MLALLKYGKYIALFLAVGIFAFMEDSIYFLMDALVYGFFEFAKIVTPLAYSFASTLLSELNLSAKLSETWLFIPLEVREAMAFFRVPEVLVILITVGISKFVLRFVPFFK